MGKKKKKKSVKVEEKNDGSESYFSFDEYLDFEVAVSTLQDCCSSLLPKIRSQLDETSIDKKALRELVLMLDYVVSEITERILCLTPQSCPTEKDEIKKKAQPRLNETISRIKQVLKLKRPHEEDDDKGKRRGGEAYYYDDDYYWEEMRRREEEDERRREDDERRRREEEEEEEEED